MTASAVEAACTPAAGPGTPASGTTVTCSGTTTDQNAPAGYGDGSQTGLTINVVGGASVAGTGAGFDLGTGNSINNSGTIQNATSNPTSFSGISTIGSATITLTNNVTGVIAGTSTDPGAAIIGVNVGNLLGSNAGSINVTGSGNETAGINASTVNFTNTGTIMAAGTTVNGTFGVLALTNVSVINSGTISADGGTGSTGTAIASNTTGTLTVTNQATGLITGTENLAGGGTSNFTFGIFAGGTGAAVITNFGTIHGDDIAIGSLSTTSNTITNTGTISGGGFGAIRIFGAAATSVENGGIITDPGSTAIRFATGVINTLTLDPGSSITGNVLGAGTDIFQLGGGGTDSFNVSSIGAAAQYQGFSTFNKIGASTWTLTGSGAQNWTINQGTLIGDTNSLAGAAITDNAALVYNQAFNGTHSGVISGSGSLTKAGSGAVILTGDNLYSGGTTISAGTLQLGNGGTTGSILGDVLDNSVFAINHSNAVTFGGVISGTGAFQQIGTGTTTFTADNTYSGGTTISAGVLQLGNGGTTGSIVGNITDNAVLAVNRSNAVTLDGAISGTGAFQQIGSGTTTLTGTNTYSGGTTISAGVLQLGNGGTTGSIVGNVLDNSVFAINRSNAFTFGGVISGTGAFQQNGTGTTDLTAINSYTGATTVNGGALQVDGSIASSSLTTVNSGATLTGVGTVGNTMIANGGTFMPGNGTPGSSMTVAGNLAFQSGAAYLVQLNPATASLANVTGTATLGGATVNAIYANGSYVAKTYTILTATGGVNGTFGSLVNTNLPANFGTSLSYDAHDAFLNLTLNFVPPSAPNFGGGLNGNQQNVANALTNFFNTNGSIPIVFGSLTPAGLTQASGEVATGSQQTTFDAMNLFMGLLTDPFIAGRGDPVTSSTGAPQFAEENDGASAYAAKDKPRSGAERDAQAAIYRKALPPTVDAFAQRWSVWAAGYGGSQTTDGNAVLGSNTVTSRIAGGVVGADYRFSPFTIAGFALAGGGTNFSIANGLGTGRSDLFQAGAFIRHTVGPAYISAALAYGWQDITTDRTVTIAGVDRLRAQFNANAFSGRVEGGYRFVTPWMGVTPYAAAQFTTFDLPAYAEQVLSGANTFALGLCREGCHRVAQRVGHPHRQILGDAGFDLHPARPLGLGA